METIEEFAKFRTVRNDNGLLGLEYRGEMIVPCQYYEITRMDDYFLCRKTGFEQHVDFDGEIYYTEESPSEKEEEEELNDGFIQTWARGKYGVLTPSRETILPPVYDEVYKWQDCDVIYTRQGAVAKYFDTDGNQILCNVRNIVDAEDELEPYYEGEPQTNVIQLMDLSDEPVGDDFCQCHGRRAGLSRRLCPEHFEYLQGTADVVPFENADRDSFLADDCYIFASFAVQSAPGCKYPVCDCIEQIAKMKEYDSSWWWMYLVLYPADAEIDVERDRWIFRCLDLDVSCNSVNGVAFGRSKHVRHGVKVIATRYFRDHWPTDEEMREVAPERDRSLSNLKEFFADCVERRQQLMDESLENIIYNMSTAALWEEKEEKLNWLVENGAVLPEGSLWRLLEWRYISDNYSSALATLKWLVDHDADVNYVKNGCTPLDLLISSRHHENVDVNPFREYLLTHGTRTAFDIRTEESSQHGFDTIIKFPDYYSDYYHE